MAKRIIVLDKLGPGSFKILYWLNIQAARQPFYAKPGAISIWPGASTPENAAIASGAIRERVETFSAEGTPGLAVVQAALEAQWTTFQAEQDATNPYLRYGSFFDDGTGWTLGGVS